MTRTISRNRPKGQQIERVAPVPIRRFNIVASLTVTLVAGTIASYSNTLNAPFLFDDVKRVQENPAIRRAWPPSAAMAGNNRPLGMYTFAINYAVHKLDVRGYHVTNLVIHIFSGLTLFGIAWRTLLRRPSGQQSSEIACGLAFAIALVWLLHPLCTQAVTYIVQRLESLMGLCYLFTLYAFIRAQDSEKHHRTWLAASIIVCAFGMGVKEVMATAPLMVLWYDRVFVTPSWRELFVKHGRYFATLFSTWAVLIWCMSRTTYEYEAGNLGFVKDVTPLGYLLTQAGVITHYLRLSFWPAGLCLDYGWPVSKSAAEIVPGLLVVGSLFAASVWAMFRRPAWGFLGGWFFVVLAPTSSIVPIIDMAFEQRMYLPLIAVVAATVIGSGKALLLFTSAPNPESFPHAKAIRQWMPIAILGLIASALGTTTFLRNYAYADKKAMWEDVVSKRPRNARARVNYGVELLNANADERSVEQCRESLRITDKDNVAAHNNLSIGLSRLGQFDEAELHARKAIELRPKESDGYIGLSTAHQGKREYARALDLCRVAIQLAPNSANAYCSLAAAMQGLGEFSAAEEACRKGIELNPQLADSFFNLGNALMAQGKPVPAVEAYRRALEIRPTDAEAHFNLGRAYQSQRLFRAAIDEYHRSLELKANQAEVYFNRSVAWFEQQRFDAAWKDLTESKRLGMEPNPAYVEALSQASGRFN